MIEADRGKEFFSIIFQKILNNNNIKHFSRIITFGAVFAERFNRTVRDHLKGPAFEKGEYNWVDILPTITKQNNNRVITSTKTTAIQVSLRKNEGHVYHNLLDKRKKVKA